MGMLPRSGWRDAGLVHVKVEAALPDELVHVSSTSLRDELVHMREQRCLITVEFESSIGWYGV